MQSKMSSIYKSILKKSTLLLGLVIAAALFAMPKVFDIARSAQLCNNPPTHAQLNYYPITYTGEACKDYPAMAGENLTDGGHYPQNTQEASAGVTGNSGDVMRFRIYIHNGAADNLPQSQTDAKNVTVTTHTDTNTGSTHAVSTSFVGTRADNGQPTNTVGGATTVHTALDERLEIVPGSGKLWDYQANVLQSGLSLGNGTYNLGTLHACFPYSVFLTFEVRVVKNTPTGQAQLQVTKDVRNVTTGTSFANQATAKIGETVEYRIVVKNNGTQVARNVVVSDTIVQSTNVFTMVGTPQVSSYFNGSLQALQLGDIAPGAQVTILYRGTVAGNQTQCLDIHNTVSASADNALRVTDSALVDVVCNQIPPPPTVAVDCRPSVPAVVLGQIARFNASGGNGSFVWSAPGGNPASGTGTTFATTYNSTGTKIITVSSAGSSDTCSVVVISIITPPPISPPPTTPPPTTPPPITPPPTTPPPVTPPPSIQPVVCQPSTQIVDTGNLVSLHATGGSGTFSWLAVGGNPSTGSGSSFSTAYSTSGTKTIMVTSGVVRALCSVVVRSTPPPTPVPTPTPGQLSINKTVRNVSTGDASFVNSVEAQNGQTVEYRIQVTAHNAAVNNVFVQETLPNGLSLVAGSVQLDNAHAVDTLSGIALGNFTTGQTKIIYFRARVFGQAGQSVTIIVNTVTVSGTGAASVSDSAQVIVRQIIVEAFGRLNINKLVRNITTGTDWQETVQAKAGDRVSFDIAVASTGTETALAVSLMDAIPAGLTLDRVLVDNNPVSSLLNNNIVYISLGDMAVNQTKRVTIETTVTTNFGTLQNIARASSQNASDVQNDAFVIVSTPVPGNPNIVLSKRAWNDTKNQDATTINASREDFITYTLSVTNNGNAEAQNFVISDDLSGVLPFADIVDNGGGTISGNSITFTPVNIAAGQTISKTFRVRIKFHLHNNATYVVKNTYGNTVTITIPGTVIFVAPPTGAAGLSAMTFGGLITAGYTLWRKRRDVLKFIIA